MANKHFLMIFIPEFASQPGYTEIIIKSILLQNDIPRKIGVWLLYHRATCDKKHRFI